MSYLDTSRSEAQRTKNILDGARSEMLTITRELNALEEGECSKEVKKAIELYKLTKELEEQIDEAERAHSNAAGFLQREEANFAPAKGGRRSKSRTHKRNKHSKKYYHGSIS